MAGHLDEPAPGVSTSADARVLLAVGRPGALRLKARPSFRRLRAREKGLVAMLSLPEAAQRGDIGAIRAALEAGAAIDAPDQPGGSTPLMLAAGAGHVMAVRYLLDRGANPNAEGDRRETAIFRAVKIGALEIAEILLDSGSKQDIHLYEEMVLFDENCRFSGDPLGWAVARQDLKMATLLLERGADPNNWVCAPAEMAILGLAISSGNMALVQELLKHGAGWEVCIYFPMYNPLHVSAIYCWKEIFSLFMSKIDINEISMLSGYSSLSLASGPNIGLDTLLPNQKRINEANRKEFIEWLLSLNIDLEKGSHPPLHCAVSKRGCVATAELLLSKGVSIDGAILEAASVETINLLLKAGANLHERDNDGNTALHKASHRPQSSKIIEYLINLGIHINVKNVVDQTPLHLAASIGWEIDSVKKLIQLGAAIDDKDLEGQTPLFLAAEKGPLATIQALLDAGADPNSRNNVGETPLHAAASLYTDRHEAIQLLINRGANPNRQDHRGRTPLHVASNRGYSGDSARAVIEALVSRGADPNARDQQGRTPLHFASSANNVDVLLECGSDLFFQDKQGETALQVALNMQEERSYFLFDVAESLFAHMEAFDPNFYEGPTALHYAVRCNRIDLIQQCLEYGFADKRYFAQRNLGYLEARDRHGRTPLDLAEELGRDELAAFLREAAEQARQRVQS